jgi:hypothetical protein
MKRWFVLLAATVLLTGLGCGQNEKDRGKYKDLDKPLPAQQGG